MPPTPAEMASIPPAPELRSTVTGAPQGPPGQQSWLPRWALWILGLCPHGWQQSTLPCRQPARTGDVGLATGSGLTPSTPLGCAFAPRLKALNFQLGKGAQHLSAFSARHGSLANRHCPMWAEGCDGARHWLWQSSRCFCCSPLVPQDRAGSAAGAHCCSRGIFHSPREAHRVPPGRHCITSVLGRCLPFFWDYRD